MSDPIEIHLPIESPEVSSIDVLHHATGLPKQRIKRAMTQGAVWLTRGRNGSCERATSYIFTTMQTSSQRCRLSQH